MTCATGNILSLQESGQELQQEFEGRTAPCITPNQGTYSQESREEMMEKFCLVARSQGHA